MWVLTIGMIVRLRIAHDTPLPSTTPVAWLLSGVAQDLAVCLIALAIALSAAPRFPRATRNAFIVVAALLNLLQIVRSEAVVFFGDVIRPEDLHGDVPIALAVGSLTGKPALLAVIALVLGAFVPALARRLHPPQWLTAFHALLAAIGVSIAAAVFAAIVPRAGLARNPLVALVAIQQEAMQAPHERFDLPKPVVSPTVIRAFAGRAANRDYVDFEFPLAYAPRSTGELASLPTGVKPNIVFILMESVRAEEVGCYGADPPNVTPNIDAIARAGIRVDNAYSAGTYTASGEVAIWYGLPPIPREVLMTSRPEVTATGFPEVLRAIGWHSFYWIHGGDSNFYRRDAFYIPRGVRIVDARSFPSDDASTNWGYSDRALARNSVTVLDRAREPFAAMVLTLSNHHPFALPQDAEPPLALPPLTRVARRSADMVQTVHYTDTAIGDFFRKARKRAWFQRTIFVITGDHGSAVEPYSRPIRTNETLLGLAHRVPLIIYSPLLRGGITIPGPASHIDVMPTLLRLVKAPVLTGLGVDLFDTAVRESRVLPMWNAHQRVLTLTTPKWRYHAAYRSTVPLETQTPVETLIDPAGDPDGLHNLAEVEPKVTARFRELANVYVTIYPWIVVHGRSGIPPDMLHRNFTAPQNPTSTGVAMSGTR